MTRIMLSEGTRHLLVIITDSVEELPSHARVGQHTFDSTWLAVDVVTDCCERNRIRTPQPTPYAIHALAAEFMSARSYRNMIGLKVDAVMMVL
jgi:hypothetical protein